MALVFILIPSAVEEMYGFFDRGILLYELRAIAGHLKMMF